MHATAPLELLRLGSVDDALGNRQGRFFGEGFKHVAQALTDITVRPATADSPGRVDATAGLTIPGTWSRKGESDQLPHLSTIDVMLFGAQLAGLYAAHTYQLPPSGPFLVRSVTIKAGTEPDEHNLDRFPVSAVLRSTVDLPELRRQLIVMDCRIASMTVRVAVEHAATGRTVAGTGSYPSAKQLPGPWNDASYGASHFGRHQFLTDVEADIAAHSATADLAITTDLAGTRRAALPPTMIDLFTSALQLAQIMLYKLDGLDRASSNTLWMRSTSITPAPAPASGEDDARFRTELLRPVRLPSANGTWRAAEIAATHAGMQLSCKVAHLLP